jgi:tetratricopeptide (TPR) repeat protein
LWQARLMARRGRHEEARALLERPEAVDEQRGRDEVLEAWCEVISEQGAWQEAADVIERARRHADWAGVPPLSLYATRLEARAAIAKGDAARAAPLFRSAAEGFARIEATWEMAITRLELVTALAELETDDEARAALRNAIDVFERLLSARELTRANEVLGRLR